MLTYLNFLFWVVLAMGLGAAIGVERQWRQRLAGLRINMLVSLGSAIFIALALSFAPPKDPSPLRVMAQIISGIGFLGVGVIMKEGLHVRDLNTAAWYHLPTSRAPTTCGSGPSVGPKPRFTCGCPCSTTCPKVCCNSMLCKAWTPTTSAR